MRLTFYMLDETVTKFEQALRPDKLQGDDPFCPIALKNLPYDAQAYLQADRETEPKWLGMVRPYLENACSLRNVNNSLLLLVKGDSRFFAVSYGFGFVALDRKHIEQGFGLRTTLNAIDPAKIKAIDVRNIDLVTRQRRTTVNLDSRLDDFELNLDQDLVQFASGQPPKNSAAGNRLQGADSLSWTSKDDIDLAGLGEICSMLYGFWSKDTYKQAFPFFDHLREVRDDELAAVLNQRLADALNQRQAEKLVLAYPDLTTWDGVECFKIYQGRKQHECDEIDVAALYAFCDSEDITEVDPRKIHVLAMDGEGHPVRTAQTLYEYAVFETQVDGQTYVLTLSKWYEVDATYLEVVDTSIGQIGPPQGLVLPEIWRKEKEGPYNERCAAGDPANLLLLDKELITVLGRSRVEACDLLSSTGHFVHVKRQAESATLSHLFAQGSVSLQLLNQHPEYREALLNQVQAKGWTLPFTRDEVQHRGSITCVYVVSSQTAGTLREVLPFFSKVNLRNHKLLIENMGYRVAGLVLPIVPKPATP